MSPDEPAAELKTLGSELKKPGRSQAALARALGFPDATYVNKIVSGRRGVKAHEMDIIRAYLARTADGRGDEEEGEHIGNTPDQVENDPIGAYVEIEVLPTFAGMGGGGTGDADRETALISRRLVEDELRARPSDLILINVRGNSMEPLFMHGDQLLIDKRDRALDAWGPFALLSPDGYVVKNVARTDHGRKVRIWSTNPEVPPEEWDPDEVTTLIVGRPVWYARHL